MQASSFFGTAWGLAVEISLLALGERGTATFALVMTLLCGAAAAYLAFKSASKISEMMWAILRVAFAAFCALSLLNALAPTLSTTLGHLFEASLGRKPLLV